MKNPLRLVALSALLLTSMAQAAESLTIDVHRDANCGCCKSWISHLQANGFKVNDHVEASHTAIINGKFVEGHVPAEQVVALTKRHDLKGIAVPGMPMGSPGMEMGDHKDAYQVIGLRNDGREEVIAEYAGN